MASDDKKQKGLQKSLALIFVYTVATGSIFTNITAFPYGRRRADLQYCGF